MSRLRQSLAKQGWYQKLSEGKYALFTCISPSLNTKVRWKDVYHRKLDLKNPRRFCEKQAYLKLKVYNKSPFVKRLAHKVLVRDYVKECGCGQYLNEIYGVWDNIDQIDPSALPRSFVLKAALGCGNHVFCRDKSALNWDEAKATLRKAWGNDSWLRYGEMQYRPDRNVKQQVFAERMLDLPEGTFPNDYKFYCYGGEPIHMTYCFNRGRDGHADFMVFDMDWRCQEELSKGCYDNIPERPACFLEMQSIAKALSKPFPFVRVDFYVEQGRPVFGEMTFTPSGGLDLDYTEEAQTVLGNLIDLTNIDYAALEVQ